MPKIKIISTPNNPSKSMAYGGPYLQGMVMQDGGYPQSFTPAGSLIDQNQWALGQSPVAGNYRKSDPTFQPSMANIGAGPSPFAPNQMSGIAPSLGMPPGLRRTTSRSFGQVNPQNMGMLLGANAALGAISQSHQYSQMLDAQRRNANSPLQTEGYADGRPNQVMYGYNNYQGGGETMPFAGTRMNLWQQGGDTGAATKLRPYMLHQGRFQQGGLQDQWDLEDAQDQTDQQPQQQQASPDQGQSDEDVFNTSDRDLRRRAVLTNEDDYEDALRIATEDSDFWSRNPYY